MRAMRKKLIAASVLAVLTAAVALKATEKRASPHEQATASLGGKKITVEYGRPYVKGREIFGKLVPWGQVWRTGADEATTLTTDADLTVGTLHVPKGTYSLFTLPTEKEWTLVFNKTAKQWGAFQYDAKQDLGRTPLKLAALPAAVEQFTIAFEPQGGTKATLKLSWDKTSANVAISAP